MDMTVHSVATCASNKEWSIILKGSSRDYQIRFGVSDRGHFQYDWSCSCEAFIYGRDYCKHIKRVAGSELRCGWNEELDISAAPTPDGLCPDCGGPVIYERVAV